MTGLAAPPPAPGADPGWTECGQSWGRDLHPGRGGVELGKSRKMARPMETIRAGSHLRGYER
jgi:hypothetical protein